jgi:hypothetical protein
METSRNETLTQRQRLSLRVVRKLGERRGTARLMIEHRRHGFGIAAFYVILL